jgi:uncharacterized lipoprotein YmbA
MIRGTRAATVLLLALSLAACGSTAASRFYVLTPAALDPGSGADQELVVAVESVSVPSILKRPQIVTRLGDHERHLDQFSRWAEPIEDNITYVLSENLVTLLGTDRVVMGDRLLEGEGVRVIVRVLELDATLGEGCTLRASWRVARPDGSTLAAGRSAHSAPLASASYEAIVAGMSQTLADLSGEIAAAIRADSM